MAFRQVSWLGANAIDAAFSRVLAQSRTKPLFNGLTMAFDHAAFPRFPIFSSQQEHRDRRLKELAKSLKKTLRIQRLKLARARKPGQLIWEAKKNLSLRL